jgi:hypothetical protein
MFSEPDWRVRRQAFPADPLFGDQWGLWATGASSLDPPQVGPNSPLLGMVEGGFDASHPDLQGVALSGTQTDDPDDLMHGTAVSSVASAPANGVGMTGVWPGARTLVVASGGGCASTVRALGRADEAGAAVVNMSYGFDGGGCFAHFVATQQLFGHGVVLVAAAGNEFLEGNPQDSNPAVDPHVITVAGLNPDLSSAYFSNENNAIDVSAPATDVLAAVPATLDQDGVPDGYQVVEGTSLASPMVAAGAAWVKALRPGLHHTQLTDLVRYSAVDMGRRGYDPRFGFGRFDLPRLLSARAPAIDPFEPNDNVSWINGKYFAAKDPPIYRGRAVRFPARIDALEDPVDTYRVVLRPRRAVRITARVTYGDPVLEAYNGWVKTIYGNRGLIDRTDRRGRRTEVLEVANPYRRGRVVFYVVLSTWRSLDAGYRLSLRPVR